MLTSDSIFIPLDYDAPLPTHFCSPHNYSPHPVAIAAAKKLMARLIEHGNGAENFGEETFSNGRNVGKMFGVLVVKTKDGQLGFISGFSGKLNGKTYFPGFVPPVYDRYETNGFFEEEELEIVQINEQIGLLENCSALALLKEDLIKLKNENATNLNFWIQEIKAAKQKRRLARQDVKSLPLEDQTQALKKMNLESANEHFNLKMLKRSSRADEMRIEAAILEHEQKILSLKSERSKRSSDLQKKLFSNYHFHNGKGKRKDLLSLFIDYGKELPPSGAGECAAPKLLEFAYKHELRPLTMAEFWWGSSPTTEIRSHRNYYAACRGKCEPILSYMLDGIACDPNPLKEKLNTLKFIKIIYKDDDIVILIKPHDLLSVPGKGNHDSVHDQLKNLFPNATGPLIVHRLDLSTSGIMVAALNTHSYKHIQRQFEERTVLKRYVAIVEGIPKQKKGTITLPLRVDLLNRPHQLVCPTYGKQAITNYEVVECYHNQNSKLFFYPQTGRTHQIRVHSAHQDGLGCQIKGDELYGKPADRLYLHAEYIEITHPRTSQRCRFSAPCEF